MQNGRKCNCKVYLSSPKRNCMRKYEAQRLEQELRLHRVGIACRRDVVEGWMESIENFRQ